MQTRDQKFAEPIFKQISEIKKLSEIKQKKYGSMAHKLPVLIRTSGLVQALAFVEARGDDTQRMLLTDIASAVELDDKDMLLRRSREDSLGEYMRLTQQVMGALLWYKRFAQSVLNVELGDEVDDTEDGSG